MIDKKYIKSLCQKLCFDTDDQQTSKIVEEIQHLSEMLEKTPVDLNNISTTPVSYPRVKNCAKFRKDEIKPKQDENYLANAKVADKYVVGK